MSSISGAIAAEALPDYKADYFSHPTPYIPPQCYTNPVDRKGSVSNPCYVCHTDGKRPNVLNDSDTQSTLTFLGSAQTNPWKNLFVDRKKQIAAIKDDTILNYVREDNYRDPKGNIKLVARINDNQKQFDTTGNNTWDGYIPDAYFDFDQEGFDKNPQGEYTGWRSFAYYPFLGTFMPTNGSTDDVLIRLHKIFQTDDNGRWNKTIYLVNLAIVESLIKEQNIAITEVDEKQLGVDLNKNGLLDKATEIVYDWAPLKNRFMTYVGAAKTALAQKKIHLAAKLFPEGTEFLHTVRYLDLADDGSVKMARRMKELRYARKKFWTTYYQHENIAAQEIKERHDFPDRPKPVIGSAEEGVLVEQGWVYQGFIEDKLGELRPQTYEEHAFCVGCHSGTGALIDSNYAFYRKFPSNQFQQGWYHWTQKTFAGISEPKRESDGEYEYSFYLAHNHTGDEYRANTEVLNKFFMADGKPRVEAFDRLHKDISYLLLPSPARALALNKAYKLIVEEQSFTKGRDAVLAPMNNLYRQTKEHQQTGITNRLRYF